MQWTTVAAVAALAIGSALTACGAEGIAARVESTTVVAPDAPAVALPVVATSPVEETVVVEPATPAGAKASEPVRGSAIPAAQLRRQILKLLGSFRTLQDLERENVERAFGVRMDVDPEADDGCRYLADTTEGWLYRVDISHFSPKGSPATIEIFLSNGVESRGNQQPTYCTLEFEPFAKELVAMGYEQGERAYRRGRDMTRGFGRDSAMHKVGFGVGVMVYAMKSDLANPQICVSGFRMGGGPLDE